MLIDIQGGAPYGYMVGARLADYRQVQTLGEDLGHARRLEVPDLDARTAAVVAAAEAIAAPWRGWWE